MAVEDKVRGGRGWGAPRQASVELAWWAGRGEPRPSTPLPPTAPTFSPTPSRAWIPVQVSKPLWEEEGTGGAVPLPLPGALTAACAGQEGRRKSLMAQPWPGLRWVWTGLC